MSKTTRAIYTVLAVILVVFIWVQVSINGQVNRSLANHRDSIETLDRGLCRLFDSCNANFRTTNTALSNFNWCVVNICDVFTNRAANVDHALQEHDNRLAAQSLRIDTQKTQVSDLRLAVATDRETVRVMSSLFAERLKDHATLFAMTGKLSESVASLTNLIRVVEQQEVRK